MSNRNSASVDVYCLCGFVGSGKTTYAKHLCQKVSALDLSIDAWMIPLFGEHMEREVFEQRKTTLENLFKEQAIQLVKLGVPVVMDYGFWRKSDREKIRHWADDNDLRVEIHYLELDFEVCKARALARNGQSDPRSYTMTPEMLSLFWSWFEPPSDEQIVFVDSAKQPGRNV